MVFTHFAWAIYSSKINILCRYCTTRNPLCGPPNEDSTRSILNECVPATVSSEMCEYRSWCTRGSNSIQPVLSPSEFLGGRGAKSSSLPKTPPPPLPFWIKPSDRSVPELPSHGL